MQTNRDEHTYTPEAWLLSFIVVVNDSLWNDLEGFGCDGRDVLRLQFLHRMTAGSYTHSHTVMTLGGGCDAVCVCVCVCTCLLTLWNKQ